MRWAGNPGVLAGFRWNSPSWVGPALEVDCWSEGLVLPGCYPGATREFHFSVASTGEVSQIINFPVTILASRVASKPIVFAKFWINLFFHRQSGDVSPPMSALVKRHWDTFASRFVSIPVEYLLPFVSQSHDITNA